MNESQNEHGEKNHSEAPSTPPAKERRLFEKARQHTNIILVCCALIFLSVYVIVHVSSLAGIVSAIFSVLTPILLGGAIAYLLNPFLKLYEYRVFKKIKKKNVLRILSLLMTYVTALLILLLLIFLLIPQLVDTVVNFATEFDSHLSDATVIINNFVSKIIGNNTEIVDEETVLSIVKGFLSSSENILEDVAGQVVKYGAGLVVGLKNILLAIFISIYVLSSKERLKAQANKFTSAVFSKPTKTKIYKYTYLCHRVFGRFFIGMIIDSVIVGIITLIVLLICNIPYALLIACIICVTNIIPIFGPFIGAIPSFLIILIADPPKAFLFLVMIIIIQQIDGNVIAPKIHGNSTGLSSLGVIIAIIIMGEYFGVVGMILGVPFFAVIVSVIKEVLDSKLAAKKLPTETAEYYEEDSLVDPYEKHETLFVKITRHIHPTLHAKAKHRHLQKMEKKANAPEKPKKEKKQKKNNKNTNQNTEEIKDESSHDQQ